MKTISHSVGCFPSGKATDAGSGSPDSISGQPSNLPATDKPSPSQSYTFAEFFCGVGLARAGFGENWECVFANDISVTKAKTYRANYGSDHLLVKDIRKVEPEELPRADLWWASFPCQDHTSAGTKKGFAGLRAALVFNVMHLLTSMIPLGTEPSVVVLENVVGLLSANNGRDFQAVLTSLVSAGYRIGCIELDAADFVPQSRRRLFIVAVHKSRELPSRLVSKSPLVHVHSKAMARSVNRLSKVVSQHWVWWKTPEPPERLLDLQDIAFAPKDDPSWRSPENVSKLLATMEPKSRSLLAEAKKELTLVYGVVCYARAQAKGSARRALKLNIDGTTWCVMAKTDLRYQQLCQIYRGEVRIRPFNKRELGYLMGVDRAFVLPQSLSATARAMGEGVVVPVVRFLAEHLLEPLVSARVVSLRSAMGKMPRRKRKRPVTTIACRVKNYPATTVYFLPDQLTRAHDLARSQEVAVHEIIIKGLDELLGERGEPALVRIRPPSLLRRETRTVRSRKESVTDGGALSRMKDHPATTAYFLPEQHKRIHKLARDHGVSLHEILLRGLDRVFHKSGLPPVLRIGQSCRS